MNLMWQRNEAGSIWRVLSASQNIYTGDKGYIQNLYSLLDGVDYLHFRTKD
jgi:hypothetical protein